MHRAHMTFGDQLHEVWTLGGIKFTVLLRRVFKEASEDNVSAYAAALAYYFMFSLFPFFLFLAALLAYIPIPDLMERIVGSLAEFVPGAASEMMSNTIENLLSETRGSLLSLGIFLSLWAASSAIVAVADSLNRAYGVKEGRPFWKVRLMAIVMTIGIAILIIVSMTLLVLGPQLGHWLSDYLGAGTAFDFVWWLMRWPVAVVLMIIAIALIYYFVPDVEQDWRWITPGSVFAVLIWIAMSLGFAYYVNNFGQYDKTYGSIGAVIILLTWLYLSGLALLIGGEINAEIEHASVSGKDPGEKDLPSGREVARRAHARDR